MQFDPSEIPVLQSLGAPEVSAAQVSADNREDLDDADNFDALLNDISNHEKKIQVRLNAEAIEGYVERPELLAEEFITYRPHEHEDTVPGADTQPEPPHASDARKAALTKARQEVAKTGAFDMHGSTVGYAWARDMKNDPQLKKSLPGCRQRQRCSSQVQNDLGGQAVAPNGRQQGAKYDGFEYRRADQAAHVPRERVLVARRRVRHGVDFTCTTPNRNGTTGCSSAKNGASDGKNTGRSS
ncbi:hypothetical protein N9L68_05075 [bacterium]|nr:hypothetical protein [bacterium]